tara:strand:+ start:206 stop:1198 length:993 start_codon:yes stop_codon:yes gene_type:complete
MKKRLLITGGTGFIGSHLAELCVRKGFNVTVFDRYNPNYNLGNLENSIYKKKIKFIFGDIRDFDSVNNAIKKNEIVFHLAALIGIPYSYESPNAYIKTNVEGTYNVLESCRKNLITKTIITSTSEVYGSAKYIPIDEQHPLQPQSPYSATKIAADNLALSYYHSFGLPVMIIRPFNTFGPRQSQRAIIPTIINQLMNKKGSKLKLGNINPTRDFLFVEDTCLGYLSCLKKGKFKGEVVNIGTGYQISIKNITKIISDILNIKTKIIKSNLRTRPKNSEVERLCASIKIAKKLLKWKPKFLGLAGLKKGLVRTIEWQIKHNQKKISNKYIV